MKYKLLIAITAVTGLAACGTPSTNSSSNLLPSSLVSAALNEPNRTLLNAVMSMSTMLAGASETVLDLDATIIQANQMTMGSEVFTTNALFNLDMGATFKTNDWMGTSPQASLEISINQLEAVQTETFGSLSNTSTVNLLDQKLSAYYDQGMVYIDLAEATALINLMDGGNFGGPLKVKTFVGSPTDLGLIEEPLTQEEIDQMIETLLPMLEMIPLLTTRIEGTSLVIRYQITENDLPDLLTMMILGDISIDTLTSQELAQLNETIAIMLEIIDLTTFILEVKVNLLTNRLTNVLVDIDVKFTNSTSYDIDFINFDEPLKEMIQQTSLTDIDVFMTMTMTVYSENRPIALPVDKEEYVLIDQ
jgi:hypothetical protein